MMDLSVVIPIKDERDNLTRLHERCTAAVAPLGRSYEIVLVDDGSVDDSFALLQKIAAADPHVKAVRLKRNFGQSAAMQAGIDWSTGDVVVTLDGDLQNDPMPCWGNAPSGRTTCGSARFPACWAIG